ncbi:hypothetical protein [Pseudomonas oryzihabitans]|uniref:hypothetical protein n=1 Tax=Pseudomonas oryzihabitans TaxID=47885 RepID=UPI0021D816E9|nr:hypothetical protein [Pseudomonas oryzihabitans]
MSFFEDLKNTKVTDTAFYLVFVLALIAPGTAYSLYFHLEVFKDLDSWKAVFMVISISAPLLLMAMLSALAGNMNFFLVEEEFKALGFVSCMAELFAAYLALGLAAIKHWDFLFTTVVAFPLAIVMGVIMGISSRFN